MTGREDPDQRTPIALIGCRGCGKSTVGRELAEMLGDIQVDTDAMIAALCGKSIAAIFDEDGEAEFRRRECEVIARVVESAPAVISVGGGAVLDSRNVEALRTTSTVVWLRAPAGVLWERVSADSATNDSRPPLTDLDGKTEIRRLLSERELYYEDAADLVIETSGKDPRGIAAEIIKQLTRSAAE